MIELCSIHHIRRLDQWLELIRKSHSINCFYRGQSEDWPLESKIRRVLSRFDIENERIFDLEQRLIREFRRKYNGSDSNTVNSDISYCLAKMQHYGAPTRMLDWSYSYFVALYFAFEFAKPNREFIIYQVNNRFIAKCYRELQDKLDINIMSSTNQNLSEMDLIFKTIHGMNYESSEKHFHGMDMVVDENSFGFNDRHRYQRGLFLAQTNIKISFEENIRNMSNNIEKGKSIIKYIFKLDKSEFESTASFLDMMNMNHISIYNNEESLGKTIEGRIPVLMKINLL